MAVVGRWNDGRLDGATGRRQKADLAKMKLVVWWKREVDGRWWSDGGWFWVLLNYLVEVPKNPQSQHIPADDGRFWFTRGAGTAGSAGTAVTGWWWWWWR